MRKSTVFFFSVTLMLSCSSGASARGDVVDNGKRIISENGKSRPLNKSNWEEEFLSNLQENPNDKPVSVQAWSKIGKIANSILEKTGTNGQISREKLGEDVKKGQLTGVEAQINAALYDNFADIKKLSPASSNKDSATLTSKDLSKLCDTALAADAAMKKVDQLTFWADDQKNLQRLSTNSAGTVSYADLMKLSKRADISPTDRTMITELENKFQTIAKNDVIGKPEIDAYFKNFRHHDAQYQLTSSFLRDLHFVAMAQQQPKEQRLFNNTETPLKDITPDAVMQGKSSDCSFKAALIGMAATRPAELLGMVHQSANNEVTVQFPNSKVQYKLQPPSAQEVGLFGGESDHGYWPTVMESAYGQKSFGALDSLSKRNFQSATDDEKAAIDRYPDDAIRTLTGHQASNVYFDKLNTNDLQNLLIKAQSDRKIVLLAIPSPTGKEVASADGFSSGHAYTFLGIDEHGVVTLRDPRDVAPIGIKHIAIDALKQRFGYLALEKD